MFDDILGHLRQLADDARQRKVAEEGDDLVRILADPKALDGYSDPQLERLLIVTSEQIKKLRADDVENDKEIDEARREEDPITGWAFKERKNEIAEGIRKRILLLRLINAERARNTDSRIDPDAERQQKLLAHQANVARIINDRTADIEGLRASGADEDTIRRRQNMWADAQAKEEEEMRQYLR